ncbi:MAG: MBL fold metallo-hydrolase [Sphingobacteriales bacterium]|nr:MBL fold metallo-hydrolase [Sphingobacteriales bacterium]OJW30671.1 MAG: MBL fold hydrolase [Sphingobacteriales bacterium 46-32]
MLTVKTFTFNPVQENTYLLYNDQGDCCIIDPGCYFDEEKNRLRQAIENAGLRPVLLLNTHCHLDHVFGNQFVADTWGLQPHIHEKERPVLDRAAEAGLRWQLPFVNYTGPVHLLEAGDLVKLGGDSMSVLFTPGHSPGSISFHNAAQHFVIGGDVLFQGSIGRTDLPGGDYDTLIDSIKTQLLPLPDDTIVYSGHGPATTIGRERRNNPFLQD